MSDGDYEIDGMRPVRHAPLRSPRRGISGCYPREIASGMSEILVYSSICVLFFRFYSMSGLQTEQNTYCVERLVKCFLRWRRSDYRIFYFNQLRHLKNGNFRFSLDASKWLQREVGPEVIESETSPGGRKAFGVYKCPICLFGDPPNVGELH